MIQAIDGFHPRCAVTPYVPTWDIGKNDVLLGWGKEARTHAGNVQYRDLIRANHSTFIQLNTTQRDFLCRAVVSIVQERGGRCLQEEKCDSSWFDASNLWLCIGDARAEKKVMQNFRDFNRRRASARRRLDRSNRR